MFIYIVIVYVTIQAVYLYNVYIFDRKTIEDKCLNGQYTIGTICDCWYMVDRYDAKYNMGNGDITNQIPVVCKMRNKAYHMLD
jgi:hypothetical protein